MNIIFGGVGGQGLVLTTQIICDAAILEGYEVKSNDIVGLSQRGGKVWGSIKYDKKVLSPNISIGECDIIVGMEPLEAQRYLKYLKPEGIVIVNSAVIPPVPVIAEKVTYPDNLFQNIDQNRIISLNATQVAKDLGTIKIANTILLGILSQKTDISKDNWVKSIYKNVPDAFSDLNLEAFAFGESFGN